MADWSQPTNTTAYTSVLTQLTGRDVSLAKQDYGSDTNIPTGAIRWNDTRKEAEKWNGSAWVAVNPLTSYTPTLSASGSMTYTSTSLLRAKSQRLGGTCKIWVSFAGTTGGTADKYLRFTLSVNAADYTKEGGACSIYEGGSSHLGGQIEFGSASQVIVSRADGANWGLGANRGVYISGFEYEV